MEAAEERGVIESVLAALETVARNKCPGGFHVDRGDKERFMNILKNGIQREPSNTESEGCKQPKWSVSKLDPKNRKNLGTESRMDCRHRVRLAVQANYPIRVYKSKPVKVGSAAGGGVGGVVGGAAGVGGGIAAGALIGSIIPVAGTIVGGIIGGIVGGIGGSLAGTGVGAAAGAGGGASVSNAKQVTIYSKEIFYELPDYLYNRDSNIVECTVVGSKALS